MMLDGEELLKWFKSSSPGFSLKDCVVDAIPVVRCKDCEYYREDKYYINACFGTGVQRYCTLHKGLAMVTPDSFCSYGKKRNAEEE